MISKLDLSAKRNRGIDLSVSVYMQADHAAFSPVPRGSAPTTRADAPSAKRTQGMLGFPVSSIL